MNKVKAYYDGGIARDRLAQEILGIGLPTSDIDYAVVGTLDREKARKVLPKDGDYFCYEKKEDFWSTVNFTINECLVDCETNVLEYSQQAAEDMKNKILRFSAGEVITARQYGYAVKYFFKFHKYGFVLESSIQNYMQIHFRNLCKSFRFRRQAFKYVDKSARFNNWSEVESYAKTQ